MRSETPPWKFSQATPPHLLTLMIMAGMSAMTMNMFLPSLPAMAEFFGTDYGLMQLSVVLFLGVNAVLQIIIGPLSDRYGRRPVILWGFGIFLAATVGCLVAPTIEVFLAFRMCQATIVAGMVLSRAIIRDLYNQDQAASMIGYLTMGMAVVPLITPAIGGFLGEHYGWKSNFWVFLVVGIAVVALIWRDLGETNVRRSTSFRQQFAEYPELLMSPRFWGYALCAAFASGAFFAYLGGAPFVGSAVFGLSPSELGLYFGTPALGYAIGNGFSGRYSAAAGINRMILIGTFITILPLLLAIPVFAAGAGGPLAFFGTMAFMGLGNGFVMPNATAGILSVRPQLAGTASGLGGALMIGGGAGLSAIAGNILGEGTGPDPLLWLMLVLTILGLAAIVFVIWRARQIRVA